MKGNPKPEDIKTLIAPAFEKQSLNSPCLFLLFFLPLGDRLV